MLLFIKRRGVMVKRAFSQHRDFKFESYTCRNENTIGEEGYGKPPPKVHYPGKKLRALSLVSATIEIELNRHTK